MATILCIDDDPQLLEIHQAFLESKGYRVLAAADGLTGIALTRKHAIDVVVLDFNMPGMDGNQVTQVLMKEQPTLPVVICSGSPEEIPESLKWFADASLHKGDGPDTLLAAIEKVVTVDHLPGAARATRRPAVRYSAPTRGRFDLHSRRA